MFYFTFHKNKYFQFDDGGWLQTLSNNTKLQVGGIRVGLGGVFQGSVSCVQIYNAAINEAAMVMKKNCSNLIMTYAAPPCPEEYHLFMNTCIQVIYIK